VTETNVFQLSQPGTFTDPLTEVLRSAAHVRGQMKAGDARFRGERKANETFIRRKVALLLQRRVFYLMLGVLLGLLTAGLMGVFVSADG
jgi:hypothetical protein